MCEIIDDSCHKNFSQHLINQPESSNRQNKNSKLQFYPSLFNFKIHRKQALDSHKFQGLLQIRQTQMKMDIYLQMHLSKSQFILSARTIQNNQFDSIKSQEIRKVKIKELSKRSCLGIIDPYQVVIDLDSGDYFIRTPIHSIYLGEMTESQFNKKLLNQTYCLVTKVKDIMAFMGTITKLDKQQISTTKQQRIKKILKYNARCTMFPELSIKSECTEYQSLTSRYAVSKFDLQALDRNHKKTLNWTRKALDNLIFYGFDINNDYKVDYLNQISVRERQTIQEQISIPPFPLSKEKHNKYNFNQCYFHQKTYQEKKIAQGGNCEVFIIKPDVHEYGTGSFEAQNKINRHENQFKYISKYLIYKKKINQTDQINHIEKASITHESQIVTYLRGGSCLFLPKYYLNIDQETPYYKKLFVDYLPGETLDKFLQLNSYTISIYTKIYLIMQVLQALRFVQNYGIVHLDVKEKNIIILKKMICKLIDFGESYQYKVCGDHHRPKYTRLYASPEVVTSVNGRLFTEKSDVFSFGIMAHKIFFDRYPYFFRDQESFEKGNFDKTLRDKTFYLPQQIEQYGHKYLICLIHQLILRCIEMDEPKRPYLDWITLIIKSCFNILTSQ